MWCRPVFEEMKDRAIPSMKSLLSLQNGIKNVPSAVQISAVLNRDERFRKVGLHHASGLSAKKSHRDFIRKSRYRI